MENNVQWREIYKERIWKECGKGEGIEVCEGRNKRLKTGPGMIMKGS